MFSLFAIVFIIVGLFFEKDSLLITSGLFAIASAIETFTTKYFENKNQN